MPGTSGVKEVEKFGGVILGIFDDETGDVRWKFGMILRQNSRGMWLILGKEKYLRFGGRGRMCLLGMWKVCAKIRNF